MTCSMSEIGVVNHDSSFCLIIACSDGFVKLWTVEYEKEHGDENLIFKSNKCLFEINTGVRITAMTAASIVDKNTNSKRVRNRM